jgi:hypothetical protein
VPEQDIPRIITDTDSALSFFSGHASLTAAVTATATYLAFTRAPENATTVDYAGRGHPGDGF